MGRPRTLLDLARLKATLIVTLDHVMSVCAQIQYRLVGTGAALLHGVQLPAYDIDILVKGRGDVEAFGIALKSFRCLEPPTWLPEARQYYANCDVDGVEVGISTVEIETDSEIIETYGRGPWEHFTPIKCGPYVVPTVALELRLITELYRNRPDRYIPIIRYMQLNGYDISLLRRGMEAGGQLRSLCEDALNKLRGNAFRNDMSNPR